MRNQKPVTGNQTEKHVYSVTELTRNIRVILEDAFSSVWVEGEVSNFTQHTSGHMYFTLKDSASQISCVIFKSVNKKLKFGIQNGMHFICFGRISVYDKRGSYQFYAEQVEPKGVGVLQLALQQLKERLSKEGLFDKERKVPIPYLPACIGVITSLTGAAIRDILNVTKRRFADVEIIINPVKVQGKGSASEIADAVRELNELNESPALGRKIDVIIVGRGGGSLEDLWSFNEEVVARAIYNSKIPVISAVGHEIDYTIADLVADLRAPTPSVAAELVIPRKEELRDRIDVLTGRLGNVLSHKIKLLKERLTQLRESYVLREPMNMFRQAKQRVDELDRGLGVALKALLEAKRQSFNVLGGKLEVLSPLAVLARGYSITGKLPGGGVLRSSKNVKIGDNVETRLGKGSFISEITKIQDTITKQ